jgi:hypothetical protein
MDSQYATCHSPVFKPLPSFDGYFCSDDGRVWSAWTPRRRIRSSTLRELRQRIDKKGYCRVSLGREQRRSLMVHRLVLMAFSGAPALGQEACHCDGNRTNNRVTNLRWDSHRANVHDSIKHGTFVVRRGCANGRAKLTDQDVLDIRRSFKLGCTIHALAAKYDVTRTAIRMILRRVTWKHVFP